MDYLLAIQPSPLVSHDAPFIALSIARITESPSCPRSIDPPLSDSNCSLTIILPPLLFEGGFVYIEM